MQARLTPEERRERNRLRSLRWRRAHGIGPRRPAERPWLALGNRRRIAAGARGHYEGGAGQKYCFGAPLDIDRQSPDWARDAPNPA
jgi:hypothetical protein